MQRDLSLWGLRGEQVPLGDELLKELGVMEDLVLALELSVLVLKRVHTVRASRDDLLHAVSLKGGDIPHRLLLIKKLFTNSPRRIPCTSFLLPQTCELDPGLL